MNTLTLTPDETRVLKRILEEANDRLRSFGKSTFSERFVLSGSMGDSRKDRLLIVNRLLDKLE